MTVLSPSGTDYHETVRVADDYELPFLTGKDEWLQIDACGGETWSIPARYVVSVVMEKRPDGGT